MKIIPSLASADQVCLKEMVERLEKLGLKELHLDIEDGNFVPNITFGLKTIKDLRKITDMLFHIHLMTNNPEKYFYELKSIGVTSVAVHIEAVEYPKWIINFGKSLGFKIGVALNPKTLPDVVEYIIDDVDFILIMTSEPDYTGQKFIFPIFKKISILSQMKKEWQEIWVDGGITLEILPKILEKKVDVIVLGRALFEDEKLEDHFGTIKNILEGSRIKVEETNKSL